MGRAELSLQSKSRRRRVRIDALIRQAEKAGKVVTSITTPRRHHVTLQQSSRTAPI